MNRRSAIGKFLLLTFGAGVGYAGYKGFSLFKKPDLSLLRENKDLIAALAETIIPRTDTPGARDCKVEDFIIQMIENNTARISQNRFIEGLIKLKEYSVTNFHKEYQLCPEVDQHKIMTHFEKMYSQASGILGKVERRYAGNSFFHTLKSYTVEGYCTSKPGASLGLSYIAVPGRFEGCVPMNKNQKAWAIN